MRLAAWTRDLLENPDILATPQARILHVILKTLLLVALVLLPTLGWIFPAMLPRTTVTLGSFLVLCPLLMWASKRGFTAAASWGLVVGLFLLQAALLPSGGGTSAPGMMTFLTLILISGVLLGKGPGLGVYLACLAFTLGIAWADRKGVFASILVNHTPYSRWGAFVLQASVVLGLQRLFSREVAQAMAILVEGRNELERLVDKRTAELAEALGTLSDLHEDLRVAHTELQRTQAGKEQFLSIVSHELRSPLTSLRGSLALLRGGMTASLAPDGQAMLDIAERNSQRLLRLVNELLDHQKVEAGAFRVDRVLLDFRGVIRLATEGIQGSLAAAQAHLDAPEPAEPLWLEGDAERLEQVLVNLLNNAINHGGSETPISLQARRQGEWIRVEVGNAGEGIPEIYRERLFQPFEQGTSGRQGSGLGLYLSKAIIQAHGGRIGFTSEPGHTVFHVDIPAAEAPAP